MPVIFITDAFIFLLLAMVIGFVFYARRHEHLRAPWREVAKRPLAMSAAVVLLVYIVIGLLDSLHFHPALDEPDNQGNTVYSTENSVLDLLLNDLRQNTERTYSAPLAAHAFAKEIIEQEDGTQVRDYPRLLYGGAYLNNPETERARYLIKKFYWDIDGGIYRFYFAFTVCLASSKTNAIKCQKHFSTFN